MTSTIRCVSTVNGELYAERPALTPEAALAVVARAKADLAARTARTPYESPMPPDVKPPLGMSKGAA